MHPSLPDSVTSMRWARAASIGAAMAWTLASLSAHAQQPTLVETQLSDMTWVAASNARGPVEKDKASGFAAAGDGGPLIVNGKTYAKGLGVYGISDVVYNLNRKCERLTAEFGLNDFEGTTAIGSKGSMIFQVWADGKKLFDSGVVRGDSPVQSVNVVLTGVTWMRLMTGANNDGTVYDQGDWLNPKVSCSSGTAPPPPPPPSTTTQKDASRLLAQATYGPTFALINTVVSKGASAWIDEQFAIGQALHHDYLNARKTATGKDPSQEDMQESIWRQITRSNDQLRQRVTFALSEIFVVSQRDGDLGGEPYAMAGYYDMLGKNAFGNFRTLMEDVTRSPVMGYYLDLLKSEKEDAVNGIQPNENYPRELLQLFSIGMQQLNADGTVKLDGGGKPIPTYDQATVEGFAKALSGWSHGGVPKTDDNFYWAPWPRPANFWRTPMQAYPTKHSTGAKLLLNGRTLPAAQTPEKDLADALDNIFNHPNVGPFIGKQLIQRLVTSNPSPAYVARVAAKFNNNGAGVRGDMKAVIKAILMDSEARSATVAVGANFGKQREPLVRLANLVRGFRGASPTGRITFYYIDIGDYGVSQAHLRAPSVFNWFAPDFAPQGEIASANLVAPEFQITTDSQIVTSINVLKYLIFWGYGFYDDPIKLDFAELLPNANNATKLVDQLDLLLCGGSMAPTTRNIIITAVNSFPATETLERVKHALWLTAISPDFAIQK